MPGSPEGEEITPTACHACASGQAIEYLVPPDIFRLRYRQALSDVVTAIVQNDEAATDQAHFTQLVLQEFAALHPGNAVRFGIRPLRRR